MGRASNGSGKSAPKANGKSKAKAKAAAIGLAPVQDSDGGRIDAGQGQAAESAADSDDVPHPSNVAYLERLQIAWDTVTAHPVFQNVVDMDPYEIEAGISVGYVFSLVIFQ